MEVDNLLSTPGKREAVRWFVKPNKCRTQTHTVCRLTFRLPFDSHSKGLSEE